MSTPSGVGKRWKWKLPMIHWLRNMASIIFVFRDMKYHTYQRNGHGMAIINIGWHFKRAVSNSALIKRLLHGPLARYVKLRIAHAPGIFSPPPLFSDPDMHHGTCVTHLPWCMPGRLLAVFGGKENVSGIPGACATRNFTYLVRGPLMAQCGLCSIYSGFPSHFTHLNSPHPTFLVELYPNLWPLQFVYYRAVP